jgi:transcriptional regulator PpsR
VTSKSEGSTSPRPGPSAPVLDRVLEASADVVLRVGSGGRIVEVRPLAGLGDPSLASWVGKTWTETVLPDTRAKAEQILEEARSRGISRTRQINQRLPGGGQVPVGVTGVYLEDEDAVLLMGRSLQSLSDLQRRLVEAQQAIERDYWKLRQMETRYRLLFQRSLEALLVLDAASFRILDVNRAAAQAFGVPARKLTGRVFPDDLGLGEASAGAIRRHLEGVRDDRRAETVTFTPPGGDDWKLEASILRDEREGVILVHLRDELRERGDVSPRVTGLVPAQLLEHGPDPFAVVDRDARVLLANRAFRNLVQIPSREEVLGESLGRWLGRPGADLSVLMTNLDKFGEVRLFPTTLNSALGIESEVELSATPIAESDPPCIGITIRNVSRRIWTEGGRTAHRDLSSAVEQMTDQVGKVSLKQLVQETVALVEAHFIESALKLTDGNRTAAAEILGVSRQSLYTKLRRYEVEGDDA